MNLLRFILVTLMATIVFSSQAFAHQVNLSYINVSGVDDQRVATIKLAYLDLEVANGIDQDFDGRITWGETKASLDKITTYLLARISLDAGGACTLSRQFAEPVKLNGEGYLSITFGVECPNAAALARVASTVFLEIDPTSKMLVSSQAGRSGATYVLGAKDAAPTSLAPTQPEPAPVSHSDGSLLSYFGEGVSHLFGGPDHMLFLLVLIIPAIFAGGGLKGVAFAVLLPITGFTLGHAITLTSAASGLIRPPAQIVEILIAVTILMTAVDNVRRFIPGPRSIIAFLFGLIHGFGFASALGALEVTGWQMGVALLGFNLGIEAGQAVLALAVSPLLYLVREPARRLLILPAGVSVLAGTMATFWVAERAGLIG